MPPNTALGAMKNAFLTKAPFSPSAGWGQPQGAVLLVSEWARSSRPLCHSLQGPLSELPSTELERPLCSHEKHLPW